MDCFMIPPNSCPGSESKLQDEGLTLKEKILLLVNAGVYIIPTFKLCP